MCGEGARSPCTRDEAVGVGRVASDLNGFGWGLHMRASKHTSHAAGGCEVVRRAHLERGVPPAVFELEQGEAEEGVLRLARPVG